ncbi:hypothetical protein Ga0080559_TMP2835 [Salipiger profundus]|uniref:Uncharacterized protein n=1 Tax=Salipiger profundus TaxID=1229727 RepID=A0A1U7D654_9RHOB|nr:hypothetical protein Ga0080559_TMP2835 [Salipiger profundus]
MILQCGCKVAPSQAVAGTDSSPDRMAALRKDEFDGADARRALRSPRDNTR